ncbi:hypothetical protein LCGC14_1822290 [marine sediment metagenome]|uniref:Uncharacterized protein n=1 Tax=marine sediment metagenome TaxID=412755 RepID=A0A0F9H6P2_9ZZZZ
MMIGNDDYDDGGGDAEEDGPRAHVHKDEHGNEYTIVAFLDDAAEDADAQRDCARERARERAREAGFDGHAVVSWYGERQGPNAMAVYLFETQRLADAFSEGTRGQSFAASTQPWTGATAEELLAFSRGKQLWARGSEGDFASMFML